MQNLLPEMTKRMYLKMSLLFKETARKPWKFAPPPNKKAYLHSMQEGYTLFPVDKETVGDAPLQASPPLNWSLFFFVRKYL